MQQITPYQPQQLMPESPDENLNPNEPVLTEAQPKGYNPAYEFAAKTLEKRKLEAQVNTLKQELAQIEPEVIDQLNEMQMTRMTFNNGATVHLRMDLRPSLVTDLDGSRTTALAALRSHDLDYLIGVNHQTLRGYVNDLKKRGLDLPPGLAEFIALNERPTVSVRAS